ncbi:hypothetical protein [Streptococcus xiaochunlingii]|uniref:hypothetical protein n=1 Tax=Streptococcus xiaochunlingii TaxID=2589788 RepID=UPI001559EC5A|nr:hypothetical protein [Streptococcus xiaochunlingii]
MNQKSEEEIETASTDFCLLAQWLIAQNTVLRRRIGIAEQGPFLINCAGAKLRNQTLRVTDFCLLAQWLIGTTPTYGTRTS